MASEYVPIYVAARAHSGSTFLDVLLGNAPDVESVGEVVSGLNRGKGELCSCGTTVGECSFWRKASSIYANQFGGNLIADAKWLFTMSDVRRFVRAWTTSLDSDEEWRRYSTLNRQLFASIASASGNRRVVDSNKEFTRALMTLRCHPSARVIHLYRDPVATIGSHYYRQEAKMPLKFLKREFYPKRTRFIALMVIACAWSVAILMGILLKARFPTRVIHVSYEALVSNPRRELERLARFLDIDLSDVIDGIESKRGFPVGHNIGGNELRHEGTFTFIPNVRGRRRLPFHYRMGVRMLTLPGQLLKATLLR